MSQAGTVYRYVRADSDHDISGDLFALSLDGGDTWITNSVTYIASGSYTPAITAANTANPVASGYVGYWWRYLSGPGTSFPLATGKNTISGKATDNPETPHFQWIFYVAASE